MSSTARLRSGSRLRPADRGAVVINGVPWLGGQEGVLGQVAAALSGSDLHLDLIGALGRGERVRVLRKGEGRRDKAREFPLEVHHALCGFRVLLRQRVRSDDAQLL